LRQYATATRYIDHARATLHSSTVTFKYQSWIAYDAHSGFCIQHAAGDELRGAVIIETDAYQQCGVTRGWRSLPNFSAAMNAIAGMTGLSAGTGYLIASLLLAGRSNEPLGMVGLSELACHPDARDCSALSGTLGKHRVMLRFADESDQIRSEK